MSEIYEAKKARQKHEPMQSQGLHARGTLPNPHFVWYRAITGSEKITEVLWLKQP